MKTHVTTTPLEGLFVVNIDFPRDDRGFFVESWNKRDFAAAGIPFDFMQDSHSRSSSRVLRGLHYQDMRAPIVKLVRCTVGKILDVAVDLRVSSPTFGKAYTIELSAENQTQLLVPIGFAHGFATLSEVCEVQYKQSGYYHPEARAVSLGTILMWVLRGPTTIQSSPREIRVRNRCVSIAKTLPSSR
jgi:dTDP-4-dehydrorhamnose 3,5-epimerase